MAQLIQEIPILKRRVLGSVNGASHGLTRTVASTQQAVSLLGAERVHDIAQRILLEHRHVSPNAPHGNVA